MTVKEARELLSEKPEHLTQEEFDDMQLIIPFGETFDGIFVSPCMGESGVTEIGVEEDSDETKESFIFAPHGFFEEESEDRFIPELN